jgi:diaminopimelate epimerase
MIGFQKIHGLGNCFIFFEELTQNLSFLKRPEIIALLCDSSHGIGSDGAVFVRKPHDPKHHCRMQMFNTDGSEAEMCGNAIRCVAHIYQHLHCNSGPVIIETAGGVKLVKYIKEENGEVFYQAEMGQALLDLVASGELLTPEKRSELIWKDRTFKPVYVNVGNPHAVIFLKQQLSSDEMKTVGAWLESHKNHPRRINVEFVEIISPREANVHIWERGCGMTQACGTGATAVAVAGIEKGHFNNEVSIHMPGGTLIIEQNDHKDLFMTGPVQEVATGTISASLLYKFRQG